MFGANHHHALIFPYYTLKLRIRSFIAPAVLDVGCFVVLPLDHWKLPVGQEGRRVELLTVSAGGSPPGSLETPPAGEPRNPGDMGLSFEAQGGPQIKRRHQMLHLGFGQPEGQRLGSHSPLRTRSNMPLGVSIELT